MLWSFYSPDAASLAEELGRIRELADGPGVQHVAGGVHATAEPVQTLDAGWDLAAVGEGERQDGTAATPPARRFSWVLIAVGSLQCPRNHQGLCLRLRVPA